MFWHFLYKHFKFNLSDRNMYETLPGEVWKSLELDQMLKIYFMCNLEDTSPPPPQHTPRGHYVVSKKLKNNWIAALR